MSRTARILTLVLLLAAALPAYPARAQDPGTGPYIEVATLGRGMVRSVAWSPAGDVIAVGGALGIWLYGPDLPDLGLLRGHSKAVYGLAFSPDGSRLASCRSRRSARAWIRSEAASARSVRDKVASVAAKASASATGIGAAAIRPRTSRPVEAKRAAAVLWSLRFMVNVLLGVFGVVGNYNTTEPAVNGGTTQLKA